MTALALIVLLTSQLPDPGSFGTITVAATFGVCMGALLAHLRGLSSERATDLARIGMLIGFGVGLLGWIVAFAIDRL